VEVVGPVEAVDRASECSAKASNRWPRQTGGLRGKWASSR
jgi:hypothetical protein